MRREDGCGVLRDEDKNDIFVGGQKSVCKFAKSEKTKMLFYEKSIIFNYTAIKIITNAQNGIRSLLYA